MLKKLLKFNLAFIKKSQPVNTADRFAPADFYGCSAIPITKSFASARASRSRI
jgi:hypothetical protein